MIKNASLRFKFAQTVIFTPGVLDINNPNIMSSFSISNLKLNRYPLGLSSSKIRYPWDIRKLEVSHKLVKIGILILALIKLLCFLDLELSKFISINYWFSLNSKADFGLMLIGLHS